MILKNCFFRFLKNEDKFGKFIKVCEERNVDVDEYSTLALYGLIFYVDAYFYHKYTYSYFLYYIVHNKYTVKENDIIRVETQDKKYSFTYRVQRVDNFFNVVYTTSNMKINMDRIIEINGRKADVKNGWYMKI